jgi:hypothetical protein
MTALEAALAKSRGAFLPEDSGGDLIKDKEIGKLGLTEEEVKQLQALGYLN